MENFETLGDYLAKYNPLAVKDDKNNIMHFKDYGEAYLYVLKVIRNYSKRGYIELPFLIKRLTTFDNQTCDEVTNVIIKLNKRIEGEVIFIDWSDVDAEEYKLKAIAEGLHYLTETTFDWAHFEYAWLLFKEYNKEKLKEDV